MARAKRDYDNPVWVMLDETQYSCRKFSVTDKHIILERLDEESNSIKIRYFNIDQFKKFEFDTPVDYKTNNTVGVMPLIGNNGIPMPIGGIPMSDGPQVYNPKQEMEKRGLKAVVKADESKNRPMDIPTLKDAVNSASHGKPMAVMGD